MEMALMSLAFVSIGVQQGCTCVRSGEFHCWSLGLWFLSPSKQFGNFFTPPFLMYSIPICKIYEINHLVCFFFSKMIPLMSQSDDSGLSNSLNWTDRWVTKKKWQSWHHFGWNRRFILSFINSFTHSFINVSTLITNMSTKSTTG